MRAVRVITSRHGSMRARRQQPRVDQTRKWSMNCEYGCHSFPRTTSCMWWPSGGLLLPNKRTCAGFSVSMRALAPEHMSSEVPPRYRGTRHRGLFQFLADVYEAEASI